MNGVSRLSLGLTFLHPPPPRAPLAPPQPPTSPGAKCHRGRASRWICRGRRASLDEQREAARAGLRWLGGGEEEGDRCLASVSLGPGSRRAWETGKEREREKLGRRVSGAERAGIGCLLGETGGQALQSPAVEFLSALSSFSFFLCVHTRC